MDKCMICGTRKTLFLQYRLPSGFMYYSCINPKCLQNAMEKLFEDNKEVFIGMYIDKKKGRSTGLSLRFDVMKRDNFRCVLCGNTAKESRLEVDHIIPFSKGGETVIENLQTLCFECNRGKNDKPVGGN